MLCESCTAGDPICNAWIACERQVAPAEPPARSTGEYMRSGDDLDSTGNGCQLVYEVGFDEDDPYTEPRRVLVCEVHP